MMGPCYAPLRFVCTLTKHTHVKAQAFFKPTERTRKKAFKRQPILLIDISIVDDSLMPALGGLYLKSLIALGLRQPSWTVSDLMGLLALIKMG